MDREFHQIEWDASLRDEVAALLRLAVREDLGPLGDSTSKALIPKGATGTADVVARQAGVIAGLPAAETVVHLFDPALTWTPYRPDGQAIVPVARSGYVT